MYFIFIVIIELIFIQNSVANNKLDSLIEGVLIEPNEDTRKDECIDKKPIKKFPPIYPDKAIQNGIEGEVNVKFSVENGNVKNPQIISTTTPRIFDKTTLDAISKWKFNPNCKFLRKTTETIKYEFQKNYCENKYIVKKSPPEYPVSALENGVEGEVILEITVKKGVVTDTKIISSKPKGVFDDSAISAIKKWRFSPKCEHAKSIEQRIRYVIPRNIY